MNKHVLRLIPLGVILVIWQILPSMGIISKFILPPISSVLESFPQLFNPNNQFIPGGFYYNFQITIYEILIAYLVSIAIALPLGFLIGYYSLLRDSLEPILYILYSIPAPLLYPAIYLLFGLGYLSKIILGILLGIFPLLINVISGLRNLDQMYFTVATAYGADGKQTFIKVALPGSMPAILSGLRLSLGGTFIGVIVGQLLASSDGGLGWIISFTAQNFIIDQMYATIIIIMLLVYLMLSMFEFLESKLLKYLR